MKNFFRTYSMTLLFSCFVSLPFLHGQVMEGMVRYSPDFRFTEGIYVTFDQVRLNKPIPNAKLLTSADCNDKDFFKKVLSSEKIYYYDGMGLRQEYDVQDIWGYSRNGVLYIQIQGNFNRITFVGSICHFVADVSYYENRYHSPYGYGYYDPYSPYYSPYSSYYSPYSYGGYSPYGSYYSPYRQNMVRNEMKQYLIDFETGKILEYEIKNAELLLMKDDQLYEEYMRLSRKKKRELLFVYVRKYNEKNPLFIPAN